MLDSTRRQHSHALAVRAPALVLIVLLAVAGGRLWRTDQAWADGDPASDVLATQALFLPQDAHFSPSVQQRLEGELFGAARGGTPLRVAVVASNADLGSVTALWRQPAAYARFLDQELALVYRGPLVVVMPNGVGVAGTGPVPRALRTALESVAAAKPTGTGGLERVSLTVAGRWLNATGQRISVGVAPRPLSAGVDVIALLALAIGAALVVACWVLSLRARPPGSRPSPS